MRHFDSPYYPRRAGVFSPLLARGAALNRWWERSGLLLVEGVTIRGTIWSVFVTGLALYLRGPRVAGLAAMGICAILASVSLVFLGDSLGTTALTLLIAIHATGVVAYYQPALAATRLLTRLVAALMLCALTVGCVYLPIRSYLEKHWVVVLRVRTQVVLIRPLSSADVLRQGERIAYRSEEINGYHALIHAGVNFAPILAAPGDEVEFSTEAFSVNGAPQPRLSNMPQSGSFTVDRNCWFAWPDVGIFAHGHGVDPSSVEMQLAMVSKKQIIGTAYERWFWRRQSF